MKSINDESFQTFGNIIDEDISDVIAYVATNVHPPKLGNRYYSSVPAVDIWRLWPELFLAISCVL